MGAEKDAENERFERDREFQKEMIGFEEERIKMEKEMLDLRLEYEKELMQLQLEHESELFRIRIQGEQDIFKAQEGLQSQP